jgi:hypothetical protein
MVPTELITPGIGPGMDSDADATFVSVAITGVCGITCPRGSVISGIGGVTAGEGESFKM